MCIYCPNIVVLYKSEDTSMINVDFMLAQRRRRLTYINPPLSIPQSEHNRSTVAQCFPKGGPMSQTVDQRQTIIGSLYCADRDCTPVRTMTQGSC